MVIATPEKEFTFKQNINRNNEFNCRYSHSIKDMEKGITHYIMYEPIKTPRIVMDKTIYYALKTSRNDCHYYISLFHVVKGDIEKIGFVSMPATMDVDWELIKWLGHHHNQGGKFNFKLKELKISMES